jgi:hypothetical protein
MPKRKISSGAAPLQQLDCSDGAKMLIDQMKQHPEEFKGYAGKFTSILDMARETSQGLSRNVKMSQRDAAAIMAAAETHLYEVWLAEDVLTNMMKPKEEPEVEKAWGPTTGRMSGKSVLSQMSGSAITNSVFVDNNTTSKYEQAYRIEQERYKLQMERERYEQEEFKRREYEHALRNTKPFGSFI